jgi:hypothetical protein
VRHSTIDNAMARWAISHKERRAFVKCNGSDPSRNANQYKGRRLLSVLESTEITGVLDEIFCRVERNHFFPFPLPDVEPISPFDIVLVRPPI